MIYRERQGLTQSMDRNQNRDRYLDNCFLLCLNRDDNTNVPEIHRLENKLMQELCQKNQEYDDDDNDEEEMFSSRQRDYMNKRKGNQFERDSRLRSQRDDENYYNHDQYSRTGKYNYRNDYNIMQNSDDELSVYEIYVPTNTLNRLSDKRIDNNMVLIDYEDVSPAREPPVPYGYPTRNIPSQYDNYGYSNQYEMPPGFPREPPQFYQNNPQQFGGYYGNEGNRVPYSPQSGPFLPSNAPIDHSNAINVRRHIYSPSQLPQGLTEGQLVMLLQKGNQYQQMKSVPPTQTFPSQAEPAISTASAVTVSHQSIAPPNSHVELFKNSEYTAPSSQMKISQAPPQIIDHQLVDDDKSSIVDEITKPMSTLNTTNLVKSSKEIDNDEKKKEKSSDLKKEKKAEKDTGDSSKKDGKKEKSSGKESKKKKK